MADGRFSIAPMTILSQVVQRGLTTTVNARVAMRRTYSLEALEKDSQNLAGDSSANLLKAERQKEPMGQQEHGSTGYGRT